MESWWGNAWHIGHEAKIAGQLQALYESRFRCSNNNVLVILQMYPDTPRCTASIRFGWASRWGERPEINVRIQCTCAEVNEFFRAYLSDHGVIVGDTTSKPWLAQQAA